MAKKDLGPISTFGGLPAKPTPISATKPHPRNYRRHPDAQIEHIRASLRQHGFYRNVVLARDGTILAGHGVVEAARREGLEEVPALYLDLDPDSPAALKILAADNELGRFAEDDRGGLGEILRQVAEIDVEGLLGTGYDQATLDALLAAPPPQAGAAPGPGTGANGAAPPTPPEEFPEFDDRIETQHKCPRCGYAFSGGKVVEAHVTPATEAPAS